MLKRGAGVVPGRERSMQHARALDALTAALGPVRFPTTKEELLRAVGDLKLPLTVRGKDDLVPLRDIVASLNASTFSSAAHVREIVSVNWEDFADVFRPGGGG